MEQINKTITTVPDCLTKLIKGEPNFLRKGKAWKINYELNNDSKKFDWGTHRYESNADHIAKSLGIISKYHCFYCDIKRVMKGVVEPEIDHFCPKTIRPIKAYYFPNLFLTCGSCNRYKRSLYHRKYLLKFDDENYKFDDYYFIDYNKGYIKVRPDIVHDDQLKARYTLMVLGINKGARPSARLEEYNIYSDANNPVISDFSYRFFIRRSTL